MSPEEKLDAYEKMHDMVRKEYEEISEKMDKLKAEGRVKSATYRQLMGRKMTYSTILELYKVYGLVR
ncbi:MAG TPA: hypothetical protein IAB26_09600 [Candidatus Limivivens merdigallinarum]|uniref:Uncharacterized protein n=1 Tax=Candidatus Limivivens merdigallinarum TaxID=2840859 RepID=A0A9D0ZW02_9FIRM|nr:hypothetical protein [Candidatus Limivivens merdigallinarum]